MAFSSNRFRSPALPSRPVQQDPSCIAWSTFLPDAAEDLLSAVEQRALEAHLATCPSCSEELAEARRGQAWLNLLKDRAPEPPSDLLANILAQTTGLVETGVSLPDLPPYLSPADLLPTVGFPRAVECAGAGLLGWLRGAPETWSSLLQPRLAMTGAMAFFSICLTLNLLGISVTRLDAQSFHQGHLERNLANTGSALLQSFQGLRVVYRVESHVHDMQAQGGEAGLVPGR